MTFELDLDDSMGLVLLGLFASHTRVADEVEIVRLGLLLINAKALAVLPYVAFLARHAVGAIVDLAIHAADAVENPVFFFLLQLFQSLLVLLNLGLPLPL